MSSLFDKLKAFVNSSIRGARRPQREPTTPDETLPQTESEAEVAEAPAHRQRLPDVTEAPQTAQIPDRSAVPTGESVSRVQEPTVADEQIDRLEGERIVDLLKGRSQQDGNP